jgi:hypothetical protein
VARRNEAWGGARVGSTKNQGSEGAGRHQQGRPCRPTVGTDRAGVAADPAVGGSPTTGPSV